MEMKSTNMLFANPSKVKILYMGTPSISAKVLRGLLDIGFDVVGAVTNPDKQKGRGKAFCPSPVKEVALEKGIKVFTPFKIREDYSFIDDISFDAIVTMAYGQIVPMDLLNKAKYGAYNLHGSLLPMLRGAAPMQRALEMGLGKTGVTLMEMVAKMDAGKMFAKKEIEILDEDNLTSLSEKVADASIDLCRDYLLDVINGNIKGEEQDESLVTFASKIDKEEEHLDLTKDINVLFNKIRMLSYEPGGYLCLDGKKMKILKAKIFDDSVSKEIGCLRLEGKKALLQAKGGNLLLEEIQLEGKNKMDGLSFANGYSSYNGALLS